MGKWADKVAMGLTRESIRLRKEKEQALRLGHLPARDLVTPEWINRQIADLSAALKAINKYWIHGGEPKQGVAVALAHMKRIRRGINRMDGEEFAKWLAAAEQAINVANKRLIMYAGANRSVKATLYTPDHIKDASPQIRSLWYKVFSSASNVTGNETAAKIATAACQGRSKTPVKDGRYTPRSVPRGNKGVWAKVYNAALRRVGNDTAKAARIADGVTGKIITHKGMRRNGR